KDALHAFRDSIDDILASINIPFKQPLGVIDCNVEHFESSIKAMHIGLSSLGTIGMHLDMSPASMQICSDNPVFVDTIGDWTIDIFFGVYTGPRDTTDVFNAYSGVKFTLLSVRANGTLGLNGLFQGLDFLNEPLQQHMKEFATQTMDSIVSSLGALRRDTQGL